MRLLLDTHVFIWAIQENARLTAQFRGIIEKADVVFISAASIWEIAIKARLGKIDGDVQELAAAIGASGFEELAMTARHAAAVAGLPRHHSDPFDRLLLAQALSEPLHLLTADRQLAAYNVSVMTI
jgi:PIN domain nuclease of toxin-antitoxin system